MKVTLAKCVLRQQPHWYVSRQECGKRKRSYFKTRAEAELEAERLRDQVKKAGEAWFSLNASERDRLMQAYAKAIELGIDLAKAIDNAVAAPADNGASPTLSKAITEIVTAKENAGRSPEYTDNLKLILKQFARGRESLRLRQVTLKHVEAFLDSKPIASRQTLRSRLSTLFKFAIRRGYRADNPCAALEPVTIPHTPPAIFTLAQVQKCLGALKAKPRALPWFVLTTFCGLRPDEARKTTRADIHIDEGWIKVEAQTTKVRQRRVVYPRPEAIRLLKAVMKKGDLPLERQPRRRAIRRLRDRLKIKAWPKDITRHTAASYWLAAEGASPADVADQLGHSESVLRKNYKALVTREQAKEFWNWVGKVKL